MVKRFKNTIRMSEDGPVDALVESESGSWTLYADTAAALKRAEADAERLAAAQVRIGELERALQRLASPTAFVYSRAASEEEIARMKYADAALSGDPATGLAV